MGKDSQLGGKFLLLFQKPWKGLGIRLGGGGGTPKIGDIILLQEAPKIRARKVTGKLTKAHLHS